MDAGSEGYLSMPKGLATYIGGLGTFGATLAGWAISSHLLWVAVVAAAAAALLGGLAFCVGFETRPRTKHATMLLSLGIAVLAGFLVFRTVAVSVDASKTSTATTEQKKTEINNKAETDGDNAPAIAGGSGNSVSYGPVAPAPVAARKKKP